MLYGSGRVELRAKLTSPAVPLTMPPPKWTRSDCIPCRPSSNCSPYDGFSGAVSRAASTALRAGPAAALRCLRASSSISWAAFIRRTRVRLTRLGRQRGGSRSSAGLALYASTASL